MPLPAERGRFCVGLGPPASPRSSRLVFRDATGARAPGIRAIALAVRAGTLAAWRERIVESQAKVAGRAWLFGEEYFCFADEGGLELALTDAAIPASDGASAPMRADEILGLRAIEIDAGSGDEMARVSQLLGMEFAGRDGPVRRFEFGHADARIAIDLFADHLAVPKAAAANTPDRLTFRVSSESELSRLRAMLRTAGYVPEERAGALVIGLHSPLIDIALSCEGDTPA
jgi:hypothetical protein